MATLRRRFAIIVAATAVACGLVLSGAFPVSAGTVTQTWLCASIFGGAGPIDYRITITAPATATRGQTATITTSIATVANHPNAVAAGTIRATSSIALSGAASGTLTATGLTNPAIQPGTPWRLEGGQAQITFTNAGDVTYRATGVNAGAWGCGAAGYPQPDSGSQSWPHPGPFWAVGFGPTSRPELGNESCAEPGVLPSRRVLESTTGGAEWDCAGGAESRCSRHPNPQ